MRKLTVADVGSLDQYMALRPALRQAIIEHKKNRRLDLGPNASLYFEDYMTMKYQVQEMMRAEHLRDPESIQEEIDAYNPLIPDGSNLKATFMLEFPDENERRKTLAMLVDIEHRIWLRIDGFEKVYGIADEDLPRSTEEKTSAVHFLRFEFSNDMIRAARSRAAWSVGCDHAQYSHHIDPLPENIASSLTRDFD
ncbi:MAG: DUF3501 family protein [Gammaproteobacteria bacterium]|nr:DUF3501 family protein [Gammaproteobacteria bacterium]MDP2141569.1 DUF3501 family protein [Gammaproteobacteria bacterium]MDP2346675.1 DUF3501 family protein [Gammaproteobacteria bacterium]